MEGGKGGRGREDRREAKARASEAKVRESQRGGKKRKILGCLPGPPSRFTGHSTTLTGGPRYTRLLPTASITAVVLNLPGGRQCFGRVP